MSLKPADWAAAAERLRDGEVGVIPTDTLYGIVGSALKPATVERIYGLRQRERDKPMIVLISAWSDFDKLHVTVAGPTRALLQKVWPGPVSVVLPVAADGLEYLHRGTRSIAFRMPAKPELRELLSTAGPLVAPSANVAGQEPATTVAAAKAYFGEEVFYLDDGHLDNPPSALVDGRFDPPKVLRPAPGYPGPRNPA